MSKKKILDKIKKMSNFDILDTLMEYSIWVAAPDHPAVRGDKFEKYQSAEIYPEDLRDIILEKMDKK